MVVCSTLFVFTACGESPINHEHNYTASVTDPTCTEKGYTTYTCACGYSYVDNYTNALEHEFTNYVYDNNATYDEDGTKTAVCNHGCGTKNVITDLGSKLIAVEKLELNNLELYLVEGENDSITATISPRNATDKSIVWHSSNSEIAEVDNGAITAKGKGNATITASTSNGKVATCQVFVCSNLFTYTVSEGKATITGFTDTTATMLVIPNEINSFPVKTIGSNAFKDRTMLTQIIIREGIETIQENGFYNCNSLIKIKLPDSLLEIGKNCFYSCKTIENITIPEQVKLIGSYAFMNCVSLKNVYFNAINCEATGTTLLLNPPYGPLTKQYRIFSDIPDNQVTIIVGKNVTAINHSIFNEDSTSTPLQFKEFIFMDPFNWFYEDTTTWEKYPVENANEYFMGKHQIYGLLKG